MKDIKMEEISKRELLSILKKIVKNEIRITYHEQKEPLMVCSSKIGGKPAVPADFIWPEFTGESYDGITESRPLSFMAQINLKEASAYDTEGILPGKGILSFFYEQVSMVAGFDPEDKGCARVYYFPDEKALVPMDIPVNMDEDAVIPELAVTFKEHVSLPECDDFMESHKKIADWDEYDECRMECGYEADDWDMVTKLLGYPDTIQSPMEAECEALSRGYRLGGPKDYEKISEQEWEDINEKSTEWMLLGTIETENEEFMFGDCGQLYFWIKKQDLKNLDFHHIWLVMQCC